MVKKLDKPARFRFSVQGLEMTKIEPGCHGFFKREQVGGNEGVESVAEDILALVVSRQDARDWAFKRMASNASSIIALQWLENERERLAKLWQGYSGNL